MAVFSWGMLFIFAESIPSWLEPSSSDLILKNLGAIPDFVGTHSEKTEILTNSLIFHLGKTSEIILFLVGAMAMVELINQRNGFDIVQRIIQSRNKRVLLWTLSLITFFLSAIIDNLTATLVMITIYRKIITDPKDRIWFAGFIIIAANAGGAWSPIGDITTTMLWIGNKVSSWPLISSLLIPSLFTLIIPLLIAYFIPAFKGSISNSEEIKSRDRFNFDAILGLLFIVLVPFLKFKFNLPPYLGMLLAFSIYGVYIEIISRSQEKRTDNSNNIKSKSSGPLLQSILKIDLSTLLFFLGLLLTISAFESTGLIFEWGQKIQNSNISSESFVVILGLISAVIDNVPLVASCLGLFQYEMNHTTWLLLSYATGTGGSILIIGSASGVLAMGLEKISFGWYLKYISPLALIGFFTGIFMCYLTM